MTARAWLRFRTAKGLADPGDAVAARVRAHALAAGIMMFVVPAPVPEPVR